MIYCEKKSVGQAVPLRATALAMVAILVPLGAVGHHDKSGRTRSPEVLERGGAK
jgi:hypothetical protein